MHCPYAQRTHRDDTKSILGQGTAHPDRNISSDGKQPCNRFPLEARERVLQGREGRGVQPLRVIDGHADGAVACEQLY